MKDAVVAAALAPLVGGCYASAQVRKQAANDFGCRQDEIVVHQLNAGYIARGCKKEAKYSVQDGGVERNSEITRATVDERPELPIDRVPGSQNRQGSLWRPLRIRPPHTASGGLAVGETEFR